MADLKTQVDRELGGALQNGAVRVAARQQARAATVGDYWHQCRALYAGGRRLLMDKAVMDAVFPSHGNEAPKVYEQRRARAFYIPYAGEIIDHLLAGFAADPVRLTAGADEKRQGEEAELPQSWKDFAEDISPPGGKKQPLGSFAVDTLREMFMTQTAWVLVDLPARDPNAAAPANRLDEEKQGLLDPYLCIIPSENVIDWECDDETGELEWVLCHWRMRKRAGLTDKRDTITDRWTYWTREGWEKYELNWKEKDAPKPETIVPCVDAKPHTFGVVPFVRLQVPDGLFAMGKLESIAREHFNKRNALGWAEYKSLFSILYEFTAPPPQGAFQPTAKGATDPNRATNQLRGQGYTQIRGEKDSAQFVGPDVAPFNEARESCAELMREMHRVTFSMALSANMDSAALQRSGDSKAKDAAQIAAILAKVGEIIREGVEVIVKLVGQIRKDTTADNVRVTGAEKFDADSIAAAIEEASSC
jgi:hypothetical protein